MFPEAKQKGTGTFRVEEQQNSLFLFGRVIKVNTFYVQRLKFFFKFHAK